MNGSPRYPRLADADQAHSSPSTLLNLLCNSLGACCAIVMRARVAITAFMDVP